MKRLRSLALVLAVLLTLPAAAGTLTITTGSAGNAAYTLSAAQDTVLAAWVTQLNAQTCARSGLAAGCAQAALVNGGTIYPSVASWLLGGPLTDTLTRVRGALEAQRATNVFNPANATTVAPAAQCIAVGLQAGCLTSALRDAICAGLGAPAGCRPQ
jgi:hypothetical protein